MGVKKASSRKKAPKGKKARAKAKLERQWGEVVDEKELQKSRVRHGKSRLRGFGDKVQESKTSLETRHRKSPTLSDQVPEEAESSDESDDEGKDYSGALSDLLQSIDKKSRLAKREGRKAESGDCNKGEAFDEGSESEMDVEGDQKETSFDEADESEIEEEIDEAMLDGERENSEMDPFSSHFNRDPLPNPNEQLTQIVDASQQTIKVSVPMLSRLLDIQLSASTFDTLKMSTNGNGSSSALSQKWLDTATSLFSFNRNVLKRGWRRTNASVLRNDPDSVDELDRKKQLLSSLQCALYPSLATYADVLITAETREV